MKKDNTHDSGYWTKDRCHEEALKYRYKRDFHRGCGSAYTAATRHGWLDEICSHMIATAKPSGYWSRERCFEEAKKYTSQIEFRTNSPGAYNALKKKGWLKDACAHMELDKHLPGYWIKEKCREEAKKYKAKSAFRKGCQGAYNSAWTHGWLDEICEHMNQTQTRGYWTLERCIKEGKKYSRRGDFRKNGKGAYNAAYVNGWLEEVCSHMDKSYLYTKEECREIALKYKVERYWRISQNASWLQAQKNGWLPELTTHMKKMHRYSKEECQEEAKKYATRTEFSELAPQYYFRACAKHWIKEICKHMERQGNLERRKIYVFEFSDNYAYVGLAMNPDKREKQHLSTNTSSVFKHIEDTGCKEYVFKVLSDDFLSSNQAAEEEENKINEYRENGWNMINIRPGGDLGYIPRKYTKEYCANIAKKYQYRFDFIKGDKAAYEGARRYGYLDEVCAHMKPKKQMPSKEEYAKIALKYKTTAEFRKENNKALEYIIRHGWYEEMCSHLATLHFWTDEEVIAEARKYDNNHVFRKNNPKAYDYARKHGIMEKCREHMNSQNTKE